MNLIPPMTAIQPSRTSLPPARTSDPTGFAAALEQASQPILKRKRSELPVTLHQMRAMCEKALAAFQHEFDSFAQEAGIDQSKQIKLQIAPDGHVYVEGSHPDKKKIEDFLRANPRVERDCHDAICFREQLQSMEEGLAFQEAYRKDPKAAIARFSHLFNSETYFALAIGAECEFEKGTRPRA